MKKRIIWLAVVCLLLAAAAVFLLKQRQNLKAVQAGMKYTKAELRQQIDEKQQQLEEEIGRRVGFDPGSLTEEDIQAVRDGSADVGGLLKKLKPDTGRPSSEALSVSTAEPNQTANLPLTENPEAVEPTAAPESAENTTEETPSAERRDEYGDSLAVLILKIYLMEDEYLGKLDEMIEQGRNEYVQLTEKNTSKTELVKWAAGFVSKAADMEQECDKRMIGILVEMEELVKGHPEDESLPGTIFQTYLDEKTLKKAIYIEELNERGLLA